MLELIRERCLNKDSPLNFRTCSAAGRLAFSFHQDLARCLVQLSPHNCAVNAGAGSTPDCVPKALKRTVQSDGSYERDFCAVCKDPACYVNQSTARIFLVCLFYLTRVSFL